MPDRPHVVIYCDGACSPNPGFGGWGAVLIGDDGRVKELSGGECDTTNNKMELLAAIKAIQALRKPCIVDIHTDSEYVKKGITEWLPGWIRRNWRTAGKEPVKNQELWQALQRETQSHEVRWHWVRGHNGDTYNERADQLAVAARLTALETYKKLQKTDERE